MNATTIALPSWTAEIQHYSQKAIFYTPIVWGAFKKTLAPVIVTSLKGVALHLIERESVWKQWTLNIAGINHNPLQSSFNAAIAELTSAEAQATYARIRHIIRETATDALVIGLCGVVAIASGVELAQKLYRQAKAAYAWVDAKLNPAEPEPVILPTVEMAIAPHQESALQQECAKASEDIEILSDEDKEYERQFVERLEQLDAQAKQDPWGGEVDYEPVEFSSSSEFVPMSDSVPALAPVYIPVIAEIANPEPHDIHQEVEDRLREIHSVKVDAPAEDIALALHVPGATAAKKRNASRKKPKPNEQDAEATASTPKRRRATAKK